jgi:hypothetical protein
MLLGDFVAKMTQAVGITPCAPCKRRQAEWNAWHAQMTGRAPPPTPSTRTFVIETHNGQLLRVTR